MLSRALLRELGVRKDGNFGEPQRKSPGQAGAFQELLASLADSLTSLVAGITQRLTLFFYKEINNIQHFLLCWDVLPSSD